MLHGGLTDLIQDHNSARRHGHNAFAAENLQLRKIHPKLLITHCFKLNRIPDAYETFECAEPPYARAQSQQRWNCRRGLSPFCCWAMVLVLPMNSAKTVTDSLPAPLSQSIRTLSLV